MKTVLVTGHSGLLGTAVSQVVAASFGGLVSLRGLSLEDCDLADEGSARRVVADVAPDVVIHAAGWPYVDECEADGEMAWRRNVLTTQHVVQACRALGCRCIYTSTDYVFDGEATPERGYAESRRPSPLNNYGLTKLYAEGLVSTLDHGIVVRTAWLFGGGTPRSSFLRQVAAAIGAGLPFQAVCDQYGSPTSTYQLAGALIRLALLPRIPRERSILHVVNRGRASWYDFAHLAVRHLFGPEACGLLVPVSRDSGVYRAVRPRDSTLDPDAAEKLLGIQMPSWREALDDELRSIRALSSVSGVAHQELHR